MALGRRALWLAYLFMSALMSSNSCTKTGDNRAICCCILNQVNGSRRRHHRLITSPSITLRYSVFSTNPGHEMLLLLRRQGQVTALAVWSVSIPQFCQHWRVYSRTEKKGNDILTYKYQSNARKIRRQMDSCSTVGTLRHLQLMPSGV